MAFWQDRLLGPFTRLGVATRVVIVVLALIAAGGASLIAEGVWTKATLDAGPPAPIHADAADISAAR